MANTFKSPLQKAVVTWLTTNSVTLSELSRRSEIDKGDLSKINSGLKGSLNMESAARLARAMGTTVEGLLAGDIAAAPALAASPPNDVTISNQAIAVGVRLIPLNDIDCSPDNPRKTFDKEALTELAASIAEQGLLQPLVVRPNGKRFTIVAGERRFRAMAMNGADAALCMVREGDDDGNTRALRIIENLQRADIKPIEEAEAFAALNAVDPVKWTATTIGKAIGKSDRFVAQRISVARNLHEDLKAKLAKGELKIEVARVMAGAPQKLQKALSNDFYALRDADDCRRKLQAKAIPLSSASFKVDEYDGEFLEEDGKRWFADKGKFTRLQTKAADAKLEKLKKDFPKAKRVTPSEVDAYVWADNGERVRPYYGEAKRAEAKSKKRGLLASDCTALVWVAENKIHAAKNIVLQSVWNVKIKNEAAINRNVGSGQNLQFRREPTTEEIEAKSLNAAITAAFGTRADLAKRLVVYAFFGNLGFEFEVETDPRPYVGDQAETLAKFIPSDDNRGYYPDTAETDKLWAKLRMMDETSIDGLLSRLMSAQIHVGAYANADGLTRAVAAELGVEIPAHLIPEPEDEEASAKDEGAADHAEAA